MKKIVIIFLLLNFIKCSSEKELKLSADAYNLLSIAINNTTTVYNGKNTPSNPNPETGSSVNLGCGLECLKATGIYRWNDNTNDGYECNDYFENGNNNSNIELGESGRLLFSLAYSGTTPINNLKVSIAPLNSDIKVYDGAIQYPYINGTNQYETYSCGQTSSYSQWNSQKTCLKSMCSGWRVSVPNVLKGKIIFRLFISSSLGNTFFDVTL
jgi:hypothetical protein